MSDDKQRCDKCHERKDCHGVYSHVFCESCWPDPWGLRTRLAAADEAAKTYRPAMALALSIPVSTITVEIAHAWIDDWKARNE